MSEAACSGTNPRDIDNKITNLAECQRWNTFGETGHWVHLTPLGLIVIVLFVIAIIFIVLFIVSMAQGGSLKSEFASGNTLVTSPASALDRTFGSCLSERGADHCGAAEYFAGKKNFTKSSHFAAHPRDIIKASRSGFLNGRFIGPDFTSTAAIDADYWYAELSGGQNAHSDTDESVATQAAAAAANAVASGAIAPAAASKFASNFVSAKKGAADAALLATQSDITR